MNVDLADENSIELELNKLNSLKNELESIIKSKRNKESTLDETTLLLEHSIAKAILRRKIQLKLIALKKYMQLVEALKEKLYLFNKIYSRFLEEEPRGKEPSGYFTKEITELPSPDEIKEKLYEIRSKYLELVNNNLVEQEDVSKT